MLDDYDSEMAKGQTKKNIEELSMNNAECMKEYIARAKYLAMNVQYHVIEITEQQISHRGLKGIPLAYAPEKCNFALKGDFSLGDLEDGLVRME